MTNRWETQNQNINKTNVKAMIQAQKKKYEDNKKKIHQLLIRDVENTNLINTQVTQSDTIWNDIQSILAGNITAPGLITFRDEIRQVLLQSLRTGRITSLQRLSQLDDQQLDIFIAELGFHRNGYKIDFIQAIPFFKYENKPIQEKDVCSVCHDDFLEGAQCILLECNHVFHRQCISQWLRLKKSCPLCKKEVKPPKKNNPPTNNVNEPGTSNLFNLNIAP